ncbi:hypothetical protein [Plastoroseomonas arctica]|nr:hypothetical protein [Plastoroseomonas arctica]
MLLACRAKAQLQMESKIGTLAGPLVAGLAGYGLLRVARQDVAGRG